MTHRKVRPSPRVSHQSQRGVGGVEHGTSLAAAWSARSTNQQDVLLQERADEIRKPVRRPTRALSAKLFPLLREMTSASRSGETPNALESDRAVAAVPRLAVNSKLLSSLVVCRNPGRRGERPDRRRVSTPDVAALDNVGVAAPTITRRRPRRRRTTAAHRRVDDRNTLNVWPFSRDTRQVLGSRYVNGDDAARLHRCRAAHARGR